MGKSRKHSCNKSKGRKENTIMRGHEQPLLKGLKKQILILFLAETSTDNRMSKINLNAIKGKQKHGYRNCLNVYFQGNDVSDLKLPNQTH